MEGIENNPVMFELMCELPWRAEKFTKEEWIKQYIRARYGTDDESIWQAWQIPQTVSTTVRQATTNKVLTKVSLRAPITE